MNKLLIIITIIIFMLSIYCIYLRQVGNDDIEHFWGWNPWKATKRTIRKVGSGAKKVYSTTKKGVKSASSGVKKIASSVKKLGGKLKSVTKKIKAIGGVFGSIFNVVDDGFGLLTKSVKMLIVIAQILFLIVDKMGKCSKGFSDANNVLKREINEIYGGLRSIKTKMGECMSLKHVYTNTYYSKCISSMFSYRIDIMGFISRLTNILNNPTLFAQLNSSKFGGSKHYCNSKFNTSEGRKFRYSRRCNQCFNIKGLMAKGHSQLLNVSSLINKSDELFNELDKLKRNMNAVF